MRFGVSNQGGDVVAVEKRIGENLGRRKASCLSARANVGRLDETHGRESMPWQQRAICSRCTPRRDDIAGVLVGVVMIECFPLAETDSKLTFDRSVFAGHGDG